MTPNDHLNVGVACIQRGYRVSGCQLLKIVVTVVCSWQQKQYCNWRLFLWSSLPVLWFTLIC